MNEVWFEILVAVVVAIVSICVTLVTKVLIPYFKAQTWAIQYEELVDTVRQAVEAFEQTIRESGQGKAKKAQVLAFVSNWLIEKGINITEQQLDILIEAAVKTMNDKDKKKEE